MIKRIEQYLNVINRISKDDISYEELYNELIFYENRDLNGNVKTVKEIFNNISDNIKKNVEFNNNSIFIRSDKDIDNSKKCIELGIFFKLGNINENIDKLIGLFNKKKIRFNGKFKTYDNVGYLSILVDDVDNALIIIDYVNSKMNKDVYDVNPLFFAVDNVMVSLKQEYSYIEILTMYLHKFISNMKKEGKTINYNGFKEYMLDNYLKLENLSDLYIYLAFNKRNIKLSSFFSNLDIITTIIIYIFNGNDYDEFKGYYRKLNKKNSKLINKYLIYDNLDDCYLLLKELVNNMCLNYGCDYAKNNLINYRNTGKVDYITRKDNLRKRVMNFKKFMVYLCSISLEDEIDKLIIEFKFENNKKILQDVCMETYLSCWDGNKNYGKIQVAKGLIRMSYGDYSAITRNNNARKLAIDNIDSSVVVELIKSSLMIDSVRKEEELYELYAEYIENLCIG